MKQVIILFILLSTTLCKAQFIHSLSISPVNPTSADSVRLIAQCSFTSGACNQHTKGFALAGNMINAWAVHCVGVLAVICPHTDTINLGLLPAGTYAATFQLDQGGGPVPCTPGIVPGPSSNLTFVVSTATSIRELSSKNNRLTLRANPVGEVLQVQFPEADNTPVEVFDMMGRRLMLVRSRYKAMIELPVGHLAQGVYVVRYKGERVQFVKE